MTAALDNIQPIRWIAFDVVGTLLFADPPVPAAYARVGGRYGSRLTEAEVRAKFAAAFRKAEQEDRSNAQPLTTDEPRERRRWRQIVGEVLDDVSEPERCFDELFEHFAQPAAWRTYPDVTDALAAFKRAGYRLAVASNFDNRLHRICDGVPELAAIELRVISSLVGFRKPARAFYQALIDAACCSAGEILMVGDDFDNDIFGARQAGLPAVFLARDNSASPPPDSEGPHAVAPVTGLDELVDLLTAGRNG